MSGRRYRKEPELEVTEPATDGAGEGMREGAQLPDSMEKWSEIETYTKRKEIVTPIYKRHSFLYQFYKKREQKLQNSIKSCTKILYSFPFPHCKTQRNSTRTYFGALKDDLY